MVRAKSVRAKTLWEDLVNTNSSFADLVSFRPHTYARTQQFLPPSWAAIIYFETCLKKHNECKKTQKYLCYFFKKNFE